MLSRDNLSGSPIFNVDVSRDVLAPLLAALRPMTQRQQNQAATMAGIVSGPVASARELLIAAVSQGRVAALANVISVKVPISDPEGEGNG